MHDTLRVEQYAQAAELPHGFLLRPTRRFDGVSCAHHRAGARAVGHPPFFHIGSDETATLGLGQTQAYVAQRGRSQAYADHIVAMNRSIAPSGARIMLWDDGIENDPGIMNLIPRDGGDRQLALRRRADVRAVHSRRSRAADSSRWSRPARATGTRSFRQSIRALANERGFIEPRQSARAFSALFQTVGTTTARRSTKRRGIRCSTRPRRRGRAGDVASGRFAADFPERVLRRRRRELRARRRSTLGAFCARLEPQRRVRSNRRALLGRSVRSAAAARMREGRPRRRAARRRIASSRTSTSTRAAAARRTPRS